MNDSTQALNCNLRPHRQFTGAVRTNIDSEQTLTENDRKAPEASAV